MLALAPILALALSSQAPVPPDATDLARLSREIAREREAVEALAADVDTARAAARAELLALEARERDLNAELASTTLRTRALLEELTRLQALRQQDATVHSSDDAAVAAALNEARALLARSVPFDLDARTARLDATAHALASFGAGAAPPLLWSHLTEERALGEAVGRGRQPVTLLRDGKETRILADTLHVGLVMLFFKTGAGTTGFAQRDGETWRWQTAPDADTRARILALFDASRHGAPQGTFLVPNALPATGGSR